MTTPPCLTILPQGEKHNVAPSVAWGLHKPSSPLSGVCALPLFVLEPDLKCRSAAPAWAHPAVSTALEAPHPAAALPRQNAPAGIGAQEELSPATPTHGALFALELPLSAGPIPSPGILRLGCEGKKVFCPAATFWCLNFPGGLIMRVWYPHQKIKEKLGAAELAPNIPKLHIVLLIWYRFLRNTDLRVIIYAALLSMRP